MQNLVYKEYKEYIPEVRRSKYHFTKKAIYNYKCILSVAAITIMFYVLSRMVLNLY